MMFLEDLHLIRQIVNAKRGKTEAFEFKWDRGMEGMVEEEL